jgi:hypothetical protein
MITVSTRTGKVSHLLVNGTTSQLACTSKPLTAGAVQHREDAPSCKRCLKFLADAESAARVVDVQLDDAVENTRKTVAMFSHITREQNQYHGTLIARDEQYNLSDAEMPGWISYQQGVLDRLIAAVGTVEDTWGELRHLTMIRHAADKLYTMRAEVAERAAAGVGIDHSEPWTSKVPTCSLRVADGTPEGARCGHQLDEAVDSSWANKCPNHLLHDRACVSTNLYGAPELRRARADESLTDAELLDFARFAPKGLMSWFEKGQRAAEQFAYASFTHHTPEQLRLTLLGNVARLGHHVGVFNQLASRVDEGRRNFYGANVATAVMSVELVRAEYRRRGLV